MSSPTSSSGNEFIHKLLKLDLVRDRGSLANLRKGLSPTTHHMAWPDLAALGAFRVHNTSTIPLFIFEKVAAFFAVHPKNSKIGNFGATWRKVSGSFQASGDKQESPFDRRFRRLLSCGSAIELGETLVGYIKIAKNHDVPIDYTRLFSDLSRFDVHHSSVKELWASQYWGVPMPFSYNDSFSEVPSLSTSESQE